jgi:molybdopterin molybdotransferase/putative molybdopterin biosynthesis protein
VRADTGDDFDDAFDAVIMIEKAAIQPDGIVLLDEDVRVSAGSNVSPSGSTIEVGTPLLEPGVVIRPTDLAVLAMGGQSTVEVIRRPKVAFIPTGSELVSAGIKPCRGQNIDTNSLMVKHMLIEMHAEPLIFPLVKDDPERLSEALDAAIAHTDIIIINAGSAVGQEDFNVSLIEARGEIIHHYIAAVPGRPMMLAVVDGKPLINLPGPPIAAYYGTDWCVRSVVAHWYGIEAAKHPTVQAYYKEEANSIAHMANLARVDLSVDEKGDYVATPFNFKAGQMAQALASNAQRISPLGESHIAAGEPILVELLRDTI